MYDERRVEMRLVTIVAVEGQNILIFLNVHGSVHRKNILIYIQQDAKLHSLFYLETALHVSGKIF